MKLTIINTVENKVLINTQNRGEFIQKVQRIFSENEEHDTNLKMPSTLHEAKDYLTVYCDNLDWFSK